MAYLQSLLTRSGADVSRVAEPPSRPRTIVPTRDVPAAAHLDPATQPIDPFRGALLAMRAGDTRQLLIQLAVIEHMNREDLQDAAAAIPRTTFTEFFRALDPLRVARDCDAIDNSHTPVGMFKKLYMESSLDYWGVRKLYTRLLRRLLILMRALKDLGYTLHLEEYIALIRCAGAASDISGAGALWNDINASPALAWRNAEVYTEYIKARFLTEPLYTNYQKVTRMVTPRNLHRSRLVLRPRVVRDMDGLRLVLRRNRLQFGLNKDIAHVEELMRTLRGQKPAVKLFRTVVATHSFRIDENLMCALMIALARAGSLRFIGANILQAYFGIRSPHPFPEEPEGQWAGNIDFSSSPARITPTVRLMRAVVETYGSNAEIAVAVQLVEYLSNTHNIPIPLDVWEDLMEWTYIMSTPPASTAWEMAGWYAKIPSPQAVEMIWNTMTSPPYNQMPTFKLYDLLIRSLIGRASDGPAPALSRMREAIALYDEQCREYEAAVFDYTRQLRDGITPSLTTRRLERARFKKQRMWYDISVWCRMIFKRMSFSKTSPVPNPLVPAFIQEFRPFLKNPVEYLTPTGRVSLVDPNIETFTVLQTGFVEQVVPMTNRWGVRTLKRFRKSKVAVLSSHALADFKVSKRTDPLNLLAPGKDVFKYTTTRPAQTSP
ncbi:hypothetical protein SAMD00023353_1600270 [Rosellinia necatrix]|uniref:Pentatricopeptide repeat domain-containing protein n=1 Tax=Rosellinia necatrix TaxID=77044 RepID=A0A1W2TKL8_ROSNE|nr:hypothetical protein SAMD00023353_1600270 [Rosellinia necatrix]